MKELRPIINKKKYEEVDKMKKEQEEKLLKLYKDYLKEYREYTNILFDSRAEGIKFKLDALREVLNILGIDYNIKD